MPELSLIINPLFLKTIKVPIVKSLIQHGGLIIIDFAMAMKLIHLPVSLISDFMIGIEELAISIHLVV